MDVTERAEAELKLKQYAENLERTVEERTNQVKALERQRAESEKLAATGRVAARIAHEINNPLAGIKNAFLLLKHAIPEDHAYFHYADRIENEINRISQIVRQMFGLYRSEDEQPKRFEVNQCIHDVVSLLKTCAETSNPWLIFENTDEPIDVHLPEGLFRQVLYNLLLNAKEVSPVGEPVRLSVTLREIG